jgi:hypothetical protein
MRRKTVSMMRWRQGIAKTGREPLLGMAPEQ